MNWQNNAAMGSTLGNGNGNAGQPGPNDMGGSMAGNGQSAPHATEYTLQGVMRFLQSEWHRHERDRNTWEIDRQEMKARIAHLEGQARRANATQKALKKYCTILEKKVKEQAMQLGGKAPAPGTTDGSNAALAQDRAAKIQELLKSSPLRQPNGAVGLGPADPATDEDMIRNDLKLFMDRCQEEFAYLMIAPANPAPPRESPPMPSIEGFRDGDGFGLPPTQQSLDQPFSQPPRPPHPQVREASARQQTQHQQGGQQQPQPQGDRPSERSVRELEPQTSHYAPADEWQAATDEGQDSNANHVNALDARARETRKHLDGTESWDFTENIDIAPNSAQSNMPLRPDAELFPVAESMPKSPNRAPSGQHRRRGSSSRRRSAEHELSLSQQQQQAALSFRFRFGMRGHLDTVRAIIFSGGGSPGEPEICTASDDGMIKRFHIPSAGRAAGVTTDLDVVADFTHRGHVGAVLSLASWSPAPNFSTGGRAQGDGWIFSGGQDTTIRVWERGRVDPKATIEGHDDSVWALCVLPTTLGAIFGATNPYGSPDRILLVSGSADGTLRVWAVSAPPQLSSPQPAAKPRAGGRVRGNSMSSGSAFPSSPQPTVASNNPFYHSFIRTIKRADGSLANPTCIAPLAPTGESFVVSYSDAAVIAFDTRSGEEIARMDSQVPVNGRPAGSANAVVATTLGLDNGNHMSSAGRGEEEVGATGGTRSMSGSGVEGTIISGHEDQHVRFFDANSGQGTYAMIAHPTAISSLSLSPDGQELVTAGHDASLRFWSLEKRTCTQDITPHRIMRGEGICAVVWSQDGRWVVSGGGDGIVKVFAR